VFELYNKTVFIFSLRVLQTEILWRKVWIWIIFD